MDMVLKSPELKAAIECFLDSRLVNAHTYDISIEFIVGRGGASATRAELALDRKPEFLYLDQPIKEDAEIIEPVRPDITVPKQVIEEPTEDNIIFTAETETEEESTASEEAIGDGSEGIKKEPEALIKKEEEVDKELPASWFKKKEV